MKDNILVKLATLFFICSILGYFYELLVYLIYNGYKRVYSHSSLFGPWLPIYGIGSIIINSISKYKDNFLIIFLLSFFLTGILEYLSGLILLKVFKMRLWDYTGYILNINGYVCFLSAFCFGIGGLIVTYIINPLVDIIINKIPNNILNKVLISLSSLFSLDLIISFYNKVFKLHIA